MPLNGKKLSIDSVGTFIYIDGRAHPAIYDPEANQRWYWPNVTYEPPREAAEWAQHALTRALTEAGDEGMALDRNFNETVQRWNIYLG